MSIELVLDRLTRQRDALIARRKPHIRGSDRYESLTRRIKHLDESISYNKGVITRCKVQAEKERIHKLVFNGDMR